MSGDRGGVRRVVGYARGVWTLLTMTLMFAGAACMLAFPTLGATLIALSLWAGMYTEGEQEVNRAYVFVRQRNGRVCHGVRWIDADPVPFQHLEHVRQRQRTLPVAAGVVFVGQLHAPNRGS